MKKSLIKATVFLLTFIAALLIIGKVMNKRHDNLTLEMTKASFPLLTMSENGVEYNQLHGYAKPMNIAYQRNTTTVLGENRDTAFVIDTFGCEVEKVSIEVRNLTGTRLIENTEITNLVKKGERIQGTIVLKDLIEPDTEYSLTVILQLDGDTSVYYYTKAVWSEKLHLQEKMEYVLDFHERLYDREAARELTKYLETNSKLEDNTSFHKVNIHSSFRQITWGELDVEECGEPVVELTEIAESTASFVLDYIVSSGQGKDKTYYKVQEYFRVRYTAERMYLLDYERTTTQIPNTDKMCANDKILLGIADKNVQMAESADGKTVVFEAAGKLYAYDLTNNRLTVVFSFYDKENADWRTLFDENAIKILDVAEGGNIQFAVYGYMNRGRHEGEVGIEVYHYDSDKNTIEELIYIPSDKSNAVLAAEMEQLLYLNRENELYLQMDGTVYCIDLAERTFTPIVNIIQDSCMQMSDNHRIIVWAEGNNIYRSGSINISNLNDGEIYEIEVPADEAIMPLGFMEEDVIYGVAKREDIVKDYSGKVLFPMYKVCICDYTGNVMKEYRQPDIYVTGCTVEDNQITLTRIQKNENGTYDEIYQDHIMNNTETIPGKNVVVTADIDIYERYVQIKVKNEIDAKSTQILNPKEVVYEGGRNLLLPQEENNPDRYYVYGPYGVSGIYTSPASAVNHAYDTAGVVVNGVGECIWLKGNRVSRNQIMAIKEASADEHNSSLAVCLDTIFKYEGLVRNSEYLLNKGQTVLQILEENLNEARVLDMSGCNLDAMLYYVNLDIPVLAILNDGEAVLLTGFNEYNVVVMEPSTGKLYKKGMNDTTEWLQENGNYFVTYKRIPD